MDVVHKFKYVISLKEVVDYYDVILQLKIELRAEFVYSKENNEIYAIVLTGNDERIKNTSLCKKYNSHFDYCGKQIYPTKQDLIYYNNELDKFNSSFVDDNGNFIVGFEYDDDINEVIPITILKKEHILKMNTLMYDLVEFDIEMDMLLTDEEKRVSNGLENHPLLRGRINKCYWKDVVETV